MKTILRLCVLMGLGLCHLAFAQSYPTKSVRFIVTYAPGGGTDTVARMIGQKLTEAWGQQVIVDNRGGGGGVVGTEIAAQAAPDGYTLLLGSQGGLVINPLMNSKLPYDPFSDFAPVVMLTTNSLLLVINPAVPATSVKEMIALAKTSPGKLNYASAGEGTPSHLAMELFQSMAGINNVHVPYRGAGLGVIDLIAGRVQLTFNPMPPLLPHVKSGKLRALAVSGVSRSAAVPEVPTIAESGLPGYGYALWYAIFVPAKTPKAIIQKINVQVVSILGQPEIKQRLIAQGTDPHGGSPDALGRFFKEDTERLRKTIKIAGAKAN